MIEFIFINKKINLEYFFKPSIVLNINYVKSIYD